MKVLHITASPFFGGPERVILDIVQSQIEGGFCVDSEIATFRENGNCEQFLSEVRKADLVGYVIERDVPNFFGALSDVVNILRRRGIDLVCAHGHKSRFLGWLAARRVGVPVIGVSHGWTWQDWKTSMYERIDQWIHHRLDKIVCVSQGQADKVIKTGTKPQRVVVIHNAIDVERFNVANDLADNSKNTYGEYSNEYLKRLIGYFDATPKVLIGAAGRLSPEKGYDVLIDAVKILVDDERLNCVGNNFCNDKYCDQNSGKDCGFGVGTIPFGLVLFGEGFMRADLQRRIDASGVSDYFKMVGFTSELDNFLPCFDVFVQSSRTEGFPCVNLEAMASGVPVVATQVGGVPEQIESGFNGILVPPEKPQVLAAELKRLIIDPIQRRKLGGTARQFVKTKFTRKKLAKEYFDLFEQVCQSYSLK
ncbi:MAG: glycosyltransferase family 4 protein [Planctomycetaceae bacterium]|jgi:glycosyltransferase involved in cell wall biosynthesis|nr:glycosyltransferase family 4 protein [Planctomycetaceae bacterium]